MCYQTVRKFHVKHNYVRESFPMFELVEAIGIERTQSFIVYATKLEKVLRFSVFCGSLHQYSDKMN